MSWPAKITTEGRPTQTQSALHSLCVYMHVHYVCSVQVICDRSQLYIHYVCSVQVICDRNQLYIHYVCKADCVSVGRKIVEARGKSRSTTFVQRVNRNFQTAHNGVFPSFAIFAGQLKRNQLYAHSLCV